MTTTIDYEGKINSIKETWWSLSPDQRRWLRPLLDPKFVGFSQINPAIFSGLDAATYSQVKGVDDELKDRLEPQFRKDVRAGRYTLDEIRQEVGFATHLANELILRVPRQSLRARFRQRIRKAFR